MSRTKNFLDAVAHEAHLDVTNPADLRRVIRACDRVTSDDPRDIFDDAVDSLIIGNIRRAKAPALFPAAIFSIVLYAVFGWLYGLCLLPLAAAAYDIWRGGVCR